MTLYYSLVSTTELLSSVFLLSVSRALQLR